MKNNLPYFSHDNDAHNHPKFKALRVRFGWEGVGRFWALNELISAAEGCELDISRPINRAYFAEELNLSLDAFTEFVTFLADRAECGLITFVDGFITTNRVKEDLERVQKKRQFQRTVATVQSRDNGGRFRRDNGGNSRCNGETDNFSTVEQSRLEENRLEQSRAEQATAAPAPPAAAALFTPTEIKSRLAFHPAEIPLDDQAVEQLARALQAVGCEDLDYLDFVLDRMVARTKHRPPANPAGYLLRVAALPDWYHDWRQAREARKAVLERAIAPPEAPARDEAVGAMLTDFLNGGLKGSTG